MTREQATEILTGIYAAGGGFDLATLKVLSDGSAAWIQRFIFTTAIVQAYTPESLSIGYDNRWCYERYTDACHALRKWNGEGDPEGWHRNPPTGRRRPNGDPAKEYVNF